MEVCKTPVNVYGPIGSRDTISFDVLLYHGVTDTTVHLMKSYLTSRKQYVVFIKDQFDCSKIIELLN